MSTNAMKLAKRPSLTLKIEFVLFSYNLLNRVNLLYKDIILLSQHKAFAARLIVA